MLGAATAKKSQYDYLDKNCDISFGRQAVDNSCMDSHDAVFVLRAWR